MVLRDEVVTIEYWYDRQSRNWVCQKKDKDGNQIGDADYWYQKADILACVRMHQKDHPNAKVIKT